MQCDAAELVCGNLSRVRHVGFNSEDARKSWNFPVGVNTGAVTSESNMPVHLRRVRPSAEAARTTRTEPLLELNPTHIHIIRERV